MNILEASPVYDHVEGSPFQPGDVVKVVDAIDLEIHEETELWLGFTGTVRYLEYNCGCGQTYPHDPMIGVEFPCGCSAEFWPEELEHDNRGVA